MHAQQDEYWKVRFAAVQALGRFGSSAESAIPLLVKVLKDGSVNRNETAITLACLGQKGMQALVDTMRVDSKASAQVRVAAAYGLSHIDVSSSFVDTVVECLFARSRERLPLVRKAVLESLATLGRRSKETVTYLRTRSLLPFFCASDMVFFFFLLLSFLSP